MSKSKTLTHEFLDVLGNVNELFSRFWIPLRLRRFRLSFKAFSWPKFSLVLCYKPTKWQFSKQKYYSNPKTYQAEHFRPKYCFRHFWTNFGQFWTDFCQFLTFLYRKFSSIDSRCQKGKNYFQVWYREPSLDHSRHALCLPLFPPQLARAGWTCLSLRMTPTSHQVSLGQRLVSLSHTSHWTGETTCGRPIGF